VTSIKSVLRLGPKSASDGKEHRLPFALQPDVEMQHATAMPRDERLPTRRLDEVGIDYIEGGHSLGEFLRQFPTVTHEMAIQALEEAKESLLARIA